MSKILPDVTGRLYFSLEGNLKLQNLTLLSKASGGKLEIAFQR